MQASMEVRWFFEEQLPKEVVKWFQESGGTPKDEDERIDIYLVLPDMKDLGIKLRAGKNVEVKRRLASRGEEIWLGSQGYLEKWAKWSFLLDPAPEGKLPDVKQPAGNWVEVIKCRRQRKFQVEAGVIKEVDPTSLPDEGCNLELSELGISGRSWGTLCFEAFGQLDTVEANLRLVLAQVQKGKDLPGLSLTQSYAYPKWLSSVAAPR